MRYNLKVMDVVSIERVNGGYVFLYKCLMNGIVV